MGLVCVMTDFAAENLVIEGATAAVVGTLDVKLEVLLKLCLPISTYYQTKHMNMRETGRYNNEN